MNLWRDTVVVVTADHGEMQGAHGGLKGKGPFSYEENAHVPLFIAQPAAKAGATSRTLTSHLDLLPTFVGLTGLPDAQRPEAVRKLPGHDFCAARRPCEGRNGGAPRRALQLCRAVHAERRLPARQHGGAGFQQTQPAIVAGQAGQARLPLFRVRRALQVYPLLCPQRVQHAADAGGDFRQQRRAAVRSAERPR